MPGHPKRRADVQRLEEDPDLGELVLQRLEEGRQFAMICAETQLSKAAILEWLEQPERAERANKARARAAESFVHDSIEIADTCEQGDEKRAKLRVTTRLWVAERWNRQLYGQRPAEVNVSLNVLHLDALRHRNSPQIAEDVTPRTLPMIENKQTGEPT